MKAGIHPTYYTDATITCANCGHVFKTGATVQEQKIEICSQCHPFFTGKKVLIDTEGRVESFQKKMSAASGGRKKKLRKKKTLEDRVNTEIALQLGKEKKKEEKEKAAREAKREAKAAVEPTVEEKPAAEAPSEEAATEETEA